MDYCLVYLSSSATLLSEQDLAGILEISHKNNSTLGVTGILLYCNGSIIQVLEGEEDKVKNLYSVIAKDPRHNRIITLYSNTIEKRSFGDWLMGFKTITEKELDHIPEIAPFVANPYSNTAESKNIVLSLVQTFYKNNHRN